MARRVVILFIAALAIGLSSLALAQRYRVEHKGHKGMMHSSPVTGQAKEYPPGTIDGSKNPELISDLKAYEVFFHSTAVLNNDSEIAKAASRQKFSRAKLNDKDTHALMDILGDFYQRRLQLNVRLNQLRKENANKDKFIELDREANNLISLAQQRVKDQLSNEGASKLHDHVMSLKTKIKILPPRVM